MGATDLREAFNLIAKPRYTCDKATLRYEGTRHPRTRVYTESQILEFSGRGADGSAFSVTSVPVPADGDILAAARATAQALIDKGEPMS